MIYYCIRYEGRECDVSIMPWRNSISIVKGFLSLLHNPSVEEFKDMLLVSQRNTWPYVPRIHVNCQVEMTLDRCVHRLRVKVAEEDANAMCNLSSHTLMPSSNFTNRSIVNLSGLSITDPVILPSSISMMSFNSADTASQSVTQDTNASDSNEDANFYRQGRLSSNPNLKRIESMTDFYYKRSLSENSF